MNNRQRKTLEAVFATPVPKNPAWAEIESLLDSLGAKKVKRDGSAVSFALNGAPGRASAASAKGGEAVCGPEHRPVFDARGDQTMNTMTYKGYTAKVEYSEEDGCFVGHLIGLRDIVGFDGASVKELKSRLHKAVDHYLWASEQLGQAPEKPYSGRMMVRVAPELHAKATVAAKTAGKSLNQWVSQALERAIEA